MTDSTGTIAFFGCTDPRLADVASLVYGQCQRTFEKRRIIPFLSPGIVGLYADERITHRVLFSREMQGDVSDEDIRRMALEASFDKHLVLHNPEIAVIAAHSDCLGFPGDDKHQKRAVKIAAKVLGYRLRRRTSFKGEVKAAIISLCPDAGWTLSSVP